MYKHTNAASRIHALLSRALEQPEQAMYLALANVFEVRVPDDRQTAERVLARLHWFYAELDLLEAQVRASSISTHLYDSAFARVRMVTSPLNLPAGWQGVRGNLTPDVLLSLAFLNELLPDEETLIAAEELQAIAQDVAELQELLSRSTLPDSLRRLIEHHVQLIIQALAQYPVQGARSLREVARTAVGEIIEAKGTITVPQNAEEISKLERLWKRVNTAADIALKAEKVGQLAQKAIDALQALTQ
jgi:hypothetical protein